MRSAISCIFVSLLVAASFSAAGSAAPDWIDLSALDAWKEPHADWALASSVRVHPDNPKLLAFDPGKEIMINGPKGRTKNLLSKQEFGDVEVQLEFFIPKSSNSGIKFEGLYEIQIFD